MSELRPESCLGCCRFTAAPTGNTNKDVGDEARETKGWFFSKKNKAKDEVKDQADQTSSWLGSKKDQVMLYPCRTPSNQPSKQSQTQSPDPRFPHPSAAAWAVRSSRCCADLDSSQWGCGIIPISNEQI